MGLLHTECTLFFKNHRWDVPGAPVAKALPSGAGRVGWIHVWEPRAHMPHGQKKTERKQQKQNTKTDLMVVLVVKKPPASAGDVRDVGSVPESGRSPGGGHDNPLQYSCLEDPRGQGSLVG